MLNYSVAELRENGKNKKIQGRYGFGTYFGDLLGSINSA